MEYPAYTDNNIFQFATKELSQDAMICWMVNNFNYPEQDPELYNLSVELLRKLMGEKAPEKIETVRILQQYRKIDVLLIVNHSIVVIIEDKVWASEHSGQIKKYKDLIVEDLANESSREALLGAKVNKGDTSVVTVYFKTGFWYDADRFTGQTVDVCIEAKNLLSILNTCKSTHPFFTDFAYRLEKIIMLEYVNIKKEFDAQNWDACLSTCYGQYLLLDAIFPNHGNDIINNECSEEKREKENCNGRIRFIYSGTNQGGTPWNEYAIWCGAYPSSEMGGCCRLFWRVDCDSKGYYISLRHYDCNAAKNNDYKERKIKAYKTFLKLIEKIPANNKLKDLIAPLGYSGGYKESTLLTMYLTAKKESMAKYVHSFNDIHDAVVLITEQLQNCSAKFTSEMLKEENSETTSI